MHRIAQLPLVLLLISLGSFSLIHLAPGDPVTAMLGPYHSSDLYEKLRTEYGLDRPFLVQYGRWVGRVLQGDFGRSIRTGEPILPLIPPRLAVSTFLAALTMGVTLLVAIPTGVVAAANHNRTPDYAAMLSTLVALSLPNFVLAIVLILVFGVYLQVLPISGIGEQPLLSWESMKLLLMPAIALAAGRAAFLARLLRSSLLETLTQDYIKVARAKGLHEQRVLTRHALRNSLIPLITLFAVEFAYLLGGVVIIEEVFVIPGMGNLLVRAVSQRDLPVVQALIVVVAGVFVVASLIADICYTVADPRVRYG